VIVEQSEQSTMLAVIEERSNSNKFSVPDASASTKTNNDNILDELTKGVGHYKRSVLPGENSNTVLSGHRDTVFREFGELVVLLLLVIPLIILELHPNVIF